MRTKLTAFLLALACAATIGAAAPAEAAPFGHATLAGKLELAKTGAPVAADLERFQVWNARHRRGRGPVFARVPGGYGLDGAGRRGGPGPNFGGWGWGWGWVRLCPVVGPDAAPET